MEKVAIEAFFCFLVDYMRPLGQGLAFFSLKSLSRNSFVYHTSSHVSIWIYATSVAATHINVRLGCYRMSVCAFCLETGSAHG